MIWVFEYWRKSYYFNTLPSINSIITVITYVITIDCIIAITIIIFTKLTTSFVEHSIYNLN